MAGDLAVTEVALAKLALTGLELAELGLAELGLTERLESREFAADPAMSDWAGIATLAFLTVAGWRSTARSV